MFAMSRATYLSGEYGSTPLVWVSIIFRRSKLRQNFAFSFDKLCGDKMSKILVKYSKLLEYLYDDPSIAFVPVILRHATSPEMAVVRPGIDPSTTASFPNKMEEKVNSCGTH